MLKNFPVAGCEFEICRLKKKSKVLVSAIYNGRRYQQDVPSSRETNHSGGK
jgi:hypothetical protein